MMSSLSASFQPEEFEKELYDFWEKSGCFDASDESLPGQKSYAIMIPPPNVTGVLHMGHALTNTIQDILIRWRRMEGDNTLWLPGVDHAGIATQNVVEKELKKQKLTRHDLGREKFLEKVWEWKHDHGEKIAHQLRRMGSSYDWKRERFTMDEDYVKAVTEEFVTLFEDGLIYRGERIINWCTRCQTALSDLEVEPTDRKASLWTLNYPVEGTTEFLSVATTRPETMLGDTAVAVHPEDERYAHLRGKRVQLPLMNRSIPIVFDEMVERTFGSGAVKITPAHDFNDYEVGVRHGLPFISIIQKDGLISEQGGAYAGLKVSEARDRVLEDLDAQGVLVKTEKHSNKVGLCQRCSNVAEPIISKQWFMKMKPLADPAIEAVRDGRIEFVPKNWEKTYFEWMTNIRDWCISRQLWWGHQIPAWHCSSCSEITVARTTPQQCRHCQSSDLTQDEDVLDTWFSSGMWPFATLGWPKKTSALQTFYPNAVMETGFDIIFFWVARMIMLGLYFMKEVPFPTVFLHAMVRDEKGQKMSKSKGNVVDPLTVSDQFGTDPLRFTLAVMAGQGRDVKLSLDRVKGYRNFCNKLWNATKFFHLQLEEGSEVSAPSENWISDHFADLSTENQWILTRLQRTIQEVQSGLAAYNLNQASQSLYDFTWREVCDWYIEMSKKAFRGERREESLIVLHYTLEQTLRLLHPMMPFVTEKLWKTLPWRKSANTPTRDRDGLPPLDTVSFQAFPKFCQSLCSESAEREVQVIQALVDAVRGFRGENQISPKKEIPVEFHAEDPQARDWIVKNRDGISSLARLSELKEIERTQTRSDWHSVIPLPHWQLELRIDLQGLVDPAEEAKRVQKELERAQKDLGLTEKKLSNPKFVERAPKELVEEETARIGQLKQEIAGLESTLRRFQKISS